MTAFLSKSDASAGFDQIVDFLNAQVIQYALMVNPTIYVSCIKQFWATVSIKKVNDVVKLRALIDRKRVVVTEDVIRHDLRLDDTDGKLEKQRRSKPSGLQRLRKVGTSQKIESSAETVMGAQEDGRKDDDNATIKEASVAEPTIFDDEEVTMTMDQTLIKMKAEKTRILDEQLAKRLHDEEIEQAIAREKEYNKVQTFLMPDRDEEPTKKKVAEETLLQESFKKLKTVEVSGSHSTQDTPTDDPKEMSEEDVKNMLEIVPVSEFKVEALQRLVKEEFSTAVPTVDKEKALWLELKRLFEPDTEDIMPLSKADITVEKTEGITLRTTSEAMDVGNFSKLMLGQGELRCIGAITLNEYINYIRKVA
nr:chaperone protein ClpB4, mitochondrial [Tanacetum cinerariifolium]